MRGFNCDKKNYVAGSDIRLVWDGSNLLPRIGHTAICRYRPGKQIGYYALLWHTPNTTVWDSGAYSWGCHPFPCDGTFDSEGNAAGTGDSGTVHFWESAGIGEARDRICTFGVNTPVQLIYDQWYTCLRKCRQIVGGADDGNYEHVFYPDVTGNPSFYISKILPAASLGSAGANPAFYIGSTDCSSSAPSDQSAENTYGVVSGIQLYNDWLSDTDHVIEAANWTQNKAQTSAGATALWYINQDPTRDDIVDKKPSGTLHTPYWATIYRPSSVVLDQKLNFKKFPIKRMRR